MCAAASILLARLLVRFSNNISSCFLLFAMPQAEFPDNRKRKTICQNARGRTTGWQRTDLSTERKAKKPVIIGRMDGDLALP
jgi:hypothetical protein